MINPVKIEVCANSVDSCLAAQEGGASRVELCDNLIEGGTTPSAASIKVARKYLDIDLNILVRPRGGDFLYNDIEFETMVEDVHTMKSLGADGVVIGILLPDGNIDTKRTEKLIQASGNLNITFHRAFDMVTNPLVALQELIDLGIHRVLSSGLKNKAPEGSKLLRKLVEKAADKIIIMPGSGIKEYNIQEMVEQTRAVEYHVSCRKTYDSKMIFRQKDVFMGGNPDLSEYEIAVTDPEKIKQIVEIANRTYRQLQQA